MMRAATLAITLVAMGCSYDWDSFDPRLSSSNASAASASAASTGSGGTGTSSTAAAVGGMGGSMRETVEYIATVAECIDPTSLMPDPDACEAATALNNLKVDLADAVTGEPSYGYLRFEVDGAIAGHEVLNATLRLTTTDHPQAPGLSAGELWEVAPFTRQDLFVAAPQQIGNVAPDQGPIEANDTVEYAVPVALVQAGVPVFLSLVPKSDDGVAYWNIEGVTPPVLSIDYR